LTVKLKRNHKILALLLCLAVALSLLTGCGGSKAEQSSAVGSAASSAPAESAAAESAAAESEPEAESAPEESAQESAPEEASQSAGEEEPEEEIYTTTGEDGITISNDASDFVLLSEAVPDAILEIRYYSTYNFVGQRVKGYEQPVALLTKEAASALKEVSDDLVERGYRLKIFDAYRPQMAVTNFVEWAEDLDDTRMKPYFYPELDKSVLFEQGYIAAHSGHSRGSTLDLTLFDMNTEREVDMGGTFDYFGELSHPDYKGVTDEQYKMRMLLREVMVDHGFRPLSEEWWHFTLEDEPYPDTYFTFPVNEDSVK
jgi:D-alanyl-D-alanine dipeptidase